ncbi:MAG TPA: type II toxin-antitoxin system HigB family toxin [Tepidisphaeraceae bacterium]|jgi:mRNA interferase HigB|nr:type II toxin-antitoxin system HigB family toxin [Tepidisphaeraceae bacterium]
MDSTGAKMTLIGQDVLSRAGRRNLPLRQHLTTWAATVENALWHSLNDVRRTYPAADCVKLKSKFVVTIFNVKGNDYRLLTSIDYDIASVEALEVLTHAEYDKGSWKDRY